MAIARREGKRFELSSPVARYWLANCVGFAVTGGSSGLVEAVYAEDDPDEPGLLLVRRGRHSVGTLPVSAVVSVVPAERTLVVERVPGRLEVLARRGAVETRRRSLVLARLSWLLTLLGWHHARRAWLVGAPVVADRSQRAWLRGKAASSHGLREAVGLIRSVPWRRFARSGRSATTSASRALSRAWSRLRTTSSLRRRESDSGREVRTTSST